MESKFNFFERVRIISREKGFEYLNNTTGTVMAKGQNDKSEWCYTVFIDYKEECYSMYEWELESLGTFIKPEDHFAGETVKVGVTKDGKGYIKNCS